MTENSEYNFVGDVMHRWARDTPDTAALLWTDGYAVQNVSFAEMKDRAGRAATVLTAAGVSRGDTVIIILGRDLPWWEICLACLQIGAVASPGTTQLSAADIKYRWKAASARAIVTNLACADKVEAACIGGDTALLLVDGARLGWTDFSGKAASAEALYDVAQTDAAEEALCYFTSGTTGYPKMTAHRHDYPLGHRATGRDWLGLAPGSLCWNLADTGWAKAAWSSLFAPWLCGATIMAHHASGFDPLKAIGILETFPVSTLCAPPTAYRMMLQAGLDRRHFDALQHCVAAGEPLGSDAVESWKNATGLTIRVGYGQTETALLCADVIGSEVRSGAMGRAVSGYELAIIDDEGHQLAPGQEGDIALRVEPERPAGMFSGYRGDIDRTKATRRGQWYLTGDRATCDEDGYFWFVGRADDVILSSGYRIGPFEVESALNSHDAVLESAVVASPDTERGEVVKAFVVLANGYAQSDTLTSELQSHVKRVTAPYKYPRAIAFVDALPKTVSGKILRRELRDAEWSVTR